ncbi:MAG TPA: AraC family transcriptional regulator [Treponemataceae bacterium]|nr:AraC family transcriptional regulator [Treponemataceae bacterium]
MVIEDAVFVYRLSDQDRISWHGRYHAHSADQYEIHFFLEGSGSFLCNRTRYSISPGRLFLTGPREFHSILPETIASPLTYYAFLFSFDRTVTTGPHQLDGDLPRALEASLAERQTVLSINSNFRFQFEDLLQLTRSADGALKESALYLLGSFLFRWFAREVASPKDVDDSVVNKARLHVEKSLAIMEKSVRENLSIEDLAWKLGLSEEHFIRIFRKSVRMTPHQYFTRLKIEGACGLLISTDKSVGEISDWFGFENQFHFSRIFSKCTGMSPVSYRKSYLQTVDFL